MGIIRAEQPITDADIPAAIARDTETTAAINAHVAALHPPAIYGFGQGVSTENVFDYGSGFLDCRNGGGTFPPGMGHIQGFQARFYYTANKWGMQLVTQNNTDNECYFRTVNQDVWGTWRRIWNDGNFNPSNYLSQTQGDSRYRQITVALTDADIPAAIARDTETTAAINAHVVATDPHPIYLTQAEGDALYAKQFTRAIFTGNCPSTTNGTTSIAHGLTASRIKSFTAFALIYPGTISEIRIQPGGAVAPFLGTNFFYSVDISPANINIRTSTNSNNVLGTQVTITIDYL